MATLENKVRRLPLPSSDVQIGRDPSCQIVIDSPYVSRLHAVIRHSKADYRIEDMDSENGTWVNGILILRPTLLKDGDRIDIALTEQFCFSMDDEQPTMPLPGLRLDHTSRRVFISGKEVSPPFSMPQYRLLHLLYQNKGQVIQREQIIHAVWPEAIEEGVSEQAIDALVRRLRERLFELDQRRNYIVTVRGHGFRYEGD